MAKALLFELGVEEIPHKILTGTLAQFREISIEKLEKAGVNFGKLHVYGTPRRLTLLLEDVEEKTAETTLERKGPSVSAAFDADKNPTKALLGFLRGNQAELSDTITKELNGGEYIFIQKKAGGEDVREIFPDLLKSAVMLLSFPKVMRWANYKSAFVRPIRWIVALFGKEVLDIQIENVKSGKSTTGHRLLGNSVFDIDNPLDYKSLLMDKEVIVGHKSRENMIRDKIEKSAARLQAKPLMDDSLLDTLVNLTEYPDVAVGTFEKEFLELPKEVLMSEMIEHQKYVPLEGKDGKLLNNFLIVTNTYPSDTIVKGNERVIRARFSDGKFFFDEDKKFKLEDFVPRLKDVSFAKGLGTLFDKVERMKKLVSILAEFCGFRSSEKSALRVAHLCKADLVTGMVGEFDELQGVMGYYYALKSGETNEVAVSVKEHYQPKFSGDALPSLPEGILVSLAERIDNLFALYAVGKFVTGSKDPFALRRQTLGVIRILIEKKLSVDFAALFDEVFPLYEDFLSIDKREFKPQILDFIKTRISTVFKEYGFSYDEIEAGIPENVSDIYDAYLRIDAIHGVRQGDGFADLAVAFKRVKNILKKEKSGGEFSLSLMKENAEHALYHAFEDSEDAFHLAIASRDYQKAAEILTEFRAPVDRFFEEVMVMDKDEAVKNNRIALLFALDERFNALIDFDKIVVE